MKKNLILPLILLFLFTFVRGQEAHFILSSAGNTSSNSEASICWTLGECFTGNHEGSLITVSHGFLIIETSVNISNTLAEFDVLVYPNPFSDNIFLRIENLKSKNLSYSFHDLKGELLIHRNIKTSISEIKLKEYSPSIYILNVLEDNKIIRSFKIIKK